MKFFKKLGKSMQGHYKAIFEEKPSPHAIAFGFSLGTLIAVLPTFGLGIFIGLFLISIFKRLNKYAMFAAFAFWNPFVLAPVVGFSYSIGTRFVRTNPNAIVGFEFFDSIYRFTVTYLVGNIVLSISLTIFTYVLMYIIFWTIFYIRRKKLDQDLVISESS
ncbi:MAG: DUF2062 domain-containing protein [Candidatus Woesearchaeota archaeon]